MLGWAPQTFWSATPTDFADAWEMWQVANGHKPDPARAQRLAEMAAAADRRRH